MAVSGTPFIGRVPSLPVHLDQIDTAARELAGLPAEAGTIRLSWFTSAGASLLPRALAALRRTHPAITVTTREGSTPALVRALRAGSLDLALLASAPPFRPPDAETPPLDLQVLAERSLCVAVPASHPLARQNAADVADLRGQRWIASPSSTDQTSWPGSRTRSPGQPPTSPTPCAPQRPPTSRRLGNPHQPRTGTGRSRSP
jgi:DNA-binding transcriptional LysR family regulator